jgi:hypothetical protein
MRSLIILAALPCVGWAVVIDRTSIVVGNHAVKDSDIRRDIRITSFLNGQQLDFSTPSRKKAASRLIDQELIRDQIRTGNYPVAPESEADQLLAQTRKDRFASDVLYRRALSQYGITEIELKDRLLWQLTVLRFIDARFRPAVVVSEQDIEQYYTEHRAELAKAHPNAKGIDDLKPEIEQVIAGERINKLLDDWLEQQRKETRIEYLDKSLQ